MDIERMKKLLTSGIEAGNKVKEVREVIKTYKTQKRGSIIVWRFGGLSQF